MNSSLFLILFKWINQLLWLLGFILLFAYHLSVASLEIETMFLPTISTFLILLFRKHPFRHAINIGVLIFTFLKACLDGQITDLSLYLSIWILLIFMIWYAFKKPSEDSQNQTANIGLAIQLVDVQALEDHKAKATRFEMWSFRFTILLWSLIAHFIMIVYLLTQKESLFDLSLKNDMHRMAISKHMWFLFYQPEIMLLTLLFLFVWALIFQNTLKSWDQQIQALEDLNQWKLWGGLFFAIVFLLISL
jgi:hypothetical protein